MQRRALTILFALVLIVAAIVLTSILSQNHEPILQESLLPSTFSTATSFDSNTLLLTNGRSLVTYNYHTGATNPISPDSLISGLNGIVSLSVSYDKKYVLFEDPSATSGGVLYDHLLAASLDPNADYWWVYNISNQQFSPLPASTSVAHFSPSSDSIVTLSQPSDGSKQSTITTYTLPSLTAGQSFSVPASATFYPTDQGYLLQTSDQQVLSTKNGIVSSVLATNTTLEGVVNNGSLAIAISSRPKTASNLLTIDPTTGKTVSIETNLLGTPIVDSTAGTILYSTGTISDHKYQNLGIYNVTTKKATQWRSEINYLLPNAPLALVDGTTNGQAIVYDAYGNYSIIGQGTVAIKSVSQRYQVAINNSEGQINLTYNSNSNQLVATLVNGDAEEQSAVYSQLQNDGYNYKLLPIEFQVSSPTVGSP